jgi:hypothetical protein
MSMLSVRKSIFSSRSCKHSSKYDVQLRGSIRPKKLAYLMNIQLLDLERMVEHAARRTYIELIKNSPIAALLSSIFLTMLIPENTGFGHP